MFHEIRAIVKRPIYILVGFCCSLFIIQPGYSQDMDWEWVVNAGGMHTDITGRGIATDNQGNIYITGYFSETVIFGSTTLTSRGDVDIFIAKLDPSGNFLWARRAGGTGSDWGKSITVNGSGNVFVTGWFRDIATFGSESHISAGKADIFFSMLNSSGSFIWTVCAGSSEDDEGWAAALDGSGNVCVTGRYSGPINIQGHELTGGTNGDIFIVKLNVLGIVIWAVRAGGLYTDKGTGIAVDGSGNIYLTGLCDFNVTFGQITLTNQYSGFFITKLNSSGSFVWARGITYPVWQYDGPRIALGGSGISYTTGTFLGEVLFGSIEANSKGYYDMYVAKLDNLGNFEWVSTAGGDSEYYGDYGFDVTVSDSGIYALGEFYGTGNWGFHTLTASGGSDIFIAKIDRFGEFEWVLHAGGAGWWEKSTRMAADDSGNLFLIGNCSEGDQFGSLIFHSEYSHHIFIAKLSSANKAPDIVLTDLTLIGYTAPDISYKITVKNNGSEATDGSKIKTRIYLSADSTITPSDYLINDWNFTEVFATGATKTSWDITTTISGIPEGEYYLGVITDANDEIAESNENNNTGYVVSSKIIIPGTSCGTEEPSGDLTTNWCFVNGSTGWDLELSGNAQAGYSVQNGEYRVLSIADSSSVPGEIRVKQSGLLLEYGCMYQVSFEGYAEEARDIESAVMQWSDPWRTYSGIEILSLTTEKKPFSYVFTMNEATDSNGAVVFDLGTSGAGVTLDNISVVKTGSTDWVAGKECTFIQKITLFQNYPNPFNPSTTIRYTVLKTCPVTLSIYDLLGREIKTLVRETQAPGEHSAVWDGGDMGAGIYMVRLSAGDFTETRKIVLQK